MSQEPSLSDRAAEEIRAMLARRDVSKSELARRLGVSHTWVTNRLAGHQDISLNELERIAKALGVPPARLLPRELVRPNERSASMDDRMMSASAPASTSSDRVKRCAPDVRPSAVSGMRRRPRVRATVTEPIPA